MRSYTRRTQFEATVLARAVVEALSNAMQPAAPGATPAAAGAAPPGESGAKVPPGQLLAMLGVRI